MWYVDWVNRKTDFLMSDDFQWFPLTCILGSQILFPIENDILPPETISNQGKTLQISKNTDIIEG